MKRIFIFTTALLVLAAGSFWGYKQWKIRSVTHIAVKGGRPLSIRLPIEGAHFMQNDPKWGAEKIGGSQESIRAVGCAMCSVATAAQALGEKTDPSVFNRELIAAGGYTPQGWLVWSAVAKVFQNRVSITVVNDLSHEAIDRALEAGQYPIAKFILPVGIPHWVVIVGKEGTDYLIHDPLVVKPEPIPFSERASSIYSVRIVKRG